jgi:alpha-beta hydrolase superfamily lysophospholipase
MTSTVGEVRARDATPLRTRSWAAVGDPWLALLLVHGLGEHSGRYEKVGEQLAAAGIGVRAFDQRGFGGSGGRRAYVARWQEFGADLADRFEALRSELPGRPAALYAHSLGGLIVLDAVVRGVVRPDLLVLSAPALGDTIAPWLRAGARLLTGVVPTLAVGDGLPRGSLSRDPAVEAAVDADPLNLRRATVRLGGETFAAQAALVRRLATLDHLPVPTYVLHGSADPIVPVASSEPLERFPEVTRVVHEGLLHECHNEPEGEAVIAAAVDWLRRAADALPSAQPKTASGERTSAESVATPQTRGT